MTSWRQLLLWDIASGKYLNLSGRADYHDWMALWVLAMVDNVNCPRYAETKDPGPGN